MTNHTDSITAVSWLTDGSRFVTGSADCTIILVRYCLFCQNSYRSNLNTFCFLFLFLFLFFVFVFVFVFFIVIVILSVALSWYCVNDLEWYSC